MQFSEVKYKYFVCFFSSFFYTQYVNIRKISNWYHTMLLLKNMFLIVHWSEIHFTFPHKTFTFLM